MQLPPVTGVTARFQGSLQGATTWYYWVQAIYAAGMAELSSSGNTGAKALAALTKDGFNQVQWNSTPGAIGYLVYRSTSSTLPVVGASVVFIAASETGVKDDGTLTAITTSFAPRIDGLFVARAIYNTNVDAIAQANGIIPALSDTIPQNAVIYGGFINVNLALTSGGSATISVGTSAGSGTASLKALTAVATYAKNAILALAVTGAASAVKMTAPGQITVSIAVADLLAAGIIEVVVFYAVASYTNAA